MMLEQIQAIFRNVFEDESLMIQFSTTANDIAMWDSLTHIELIASIEEAFQLKFTFQEVMTFNSVGDMMQVISQKLNKA